MEVGAAVWVKDKEGEEAWVAGTVLEKSAGQPCKVEIEVDEEFSEEPLTFTLREEDGYELEDLKLANDEEMDHVEDLIALPHLHEAAILHSLCRRFDRGDIYTFTANAILLAVNPFKRLPLYGKELLTEYFNMGYMRQQGIEPPQALGPHVFAIADSAYRDMMKGIHAGKSAGMGPVNQSILISGESGAGKTESTKFVMRYLTTVGNGEDGVELEKGSIMDRVLQSNPILEAFGNARTIRNDNSSRFGKFIELMFNKRGNLLGAGIETYLLEKVRIPTQAENERNFHIFYQMCKGGDDEERERWELQGPEEYHFVNQGDCYDLRKVEDEDEFVHTKAALTTMGFEASSIQTIFDIMAGLIHLGELEFEANEEDEAAMLSDEEENQECMARVCRLCYLPEEGLLRALTSKTIEVGPRKEKTTIKLKDHQAYDARDALAKAFYGQLFNWLVATINSHINCDRKEVKASVGVLDIFGFECFEHNSFEQLCINYTNETLQQQFNQFVFKMEQKEYSKEGIEWSFVEFPDNQDCLDLIEGKKKGLLTMLDDECRMGIRGTDANYASRLYKEHAETERFEADSAMRTKLCFAVKHYAGQVEYHVETFCDKNKDELPKESDELFASSANDFVVNLFAPAGAKKAKTKGKKPAAPKPKKDASGVAGLKPTVGTQFKDQLHNLMDMIRDTRPHYIRCIKPNDNAEPDEVSRVRVMEQLRYGGVLEAVRVARSGYPVRLPHKDFYVRYRCLISLNKKVKKSRYPLRLKGGTAMAQKMCKDLVKHVLSPAMVSMKNIPADTMQFGKNKVFLRKNAYDFLEMIRSRRITSAAVTLERVARGFVMRRKFSSAIRAVRFIQRVSRGTIARRRVEHMRRMRAALRTQTAYRRHFARKNFLSIKGAALALQCATRWRKAVKVHTELRRQHRSTKIQSWYRMLAPWRAHRKLRSATLALQCRMRQKIAYGELRDLRIKAKDVGNLKGDNDRLKAEVLALRQAAAASKAAAPASDEQVSSSSSSRKEVDSLRREVVTLRARVAELELQLAEGVVAKSRVPATAASPSSPPQQQPSLRTAKSYPVARAAASSLSTVDETESLPRRQRGRFSSTSAVDSSSDKNDGSSRHQAGVTLSFLCEMGVAIRDHTSMFRHF
ncbi:unnamed protein product [Ectocarpus fasciculatus]